MEVFQATYQAGTHWDFSSWPGEASTLASCWLPWALGLSHRIKDHPSWRITRLPGGKRDPRSLASNMFTKGQDLL